MPIDVQALRDDLLDLKLKSVLILGSSEVMRTKQVKGPLALAHLAVLTPSDEEKAWLEAVIKTGVENADTEHFKRLVDHAAEHGSQLAVILDPTLMKLASISQLKTAVLDATKYLKK